MLSEPLSLVAALFGGILLLQAQLAAAVTPLTPSICSVNCTITTLSAAGCTLTDVQNCLCTNMTLQLQLANCVYKSCNFTEQQTAAHILQDQLCLGVPPLESRETEIIRGQYLLAAFTFPIVILRMISRIWVARRVWWDDWMVVIAATFMIPNTAIPIWTAYHGFGLHIWNVHPEKIIILTKLYYVATIFYAIIQNLAKFSILFLYLRIFPAQGFRLLVKISMIFMLCHTIAFTLSVIFQCTPIKAMWTSPIAGKCMDMHALVVAGAALSILEDLVIITLPVTQLMALHLSKKKRVALFLMFALGSLACVASMVRLKVIIDFNPNPGVDSTWTTIDPTIWSDIETYMAINCSCLMCLRPLISKCFPKVFGSTNATDNTASDANVSSDDKMKPYSNCKRDTGTPSKLWADRWGSSTFGTRSSRSDDDIIIIQQRNAEELELREMPTSPSTRNGCGTPGSEEIESFHHGV
ncbi:uncharacterized protein RSE6_13775 [Rhynchosporium secalis]|uniref:CFEM domain-containing protein n=1 Tax=Rhynchosporium secalis TaxID=38038 RepID=A0A1E1MTQ5_RHYSE|nr:uncharacterized protein RSE6_13775 [Rhynchosporium secalis]